MTFIQKLLGRTDGHNDLADALAEGTRELVRLENEFTPTIEESLVSRQERKFSDALITLEARELDLEDKIRQLGKDLQEVRHCLAAFRTAHQVITNTDTVGFSNDPRRASEI